MSNPSDERPDPTSAAPGGPPENQPEAGAAQDDDLYAVSEPSPDPPDLAVGETTPVWFAAGADGKREGPLNLAEMKRRIATGKLTAESLVWKGGMAGWTPLGSVPELSEARTGSQPLPPPTPGGAAAGHAPKLSELMRPIDQAFSCPLVYRLTGRVCAILAVITFLGSMLGLIWGRTWFAEALFLALIFFVGEAAGTMIEGLRRVQAPTTPPQAAEEAPGK